MAPIHSSEGTIAFPALDAGKDCYTWYKVFGDLSCATIPLVALHGGPGACHHYLLCLEDLSSQYHIPVILYDQLGCGNSTHLPEKNSDDAFWTVELFEQELDNLVNHLGLAQYDLYGHSWGGMLASKYASKRPDGLRKLILMSTPASTDLLLKGNSELRSELPLHLQEVIRRHEARSDFEAPAYKDACKEFYRRFYCRCDAYPPDLIESRRVRAYDTTVYRTMWGPTEVTCTGSLKDWTVIPHAHNIQSTTLLINGDYDLVAEASSAPLFQTIPKVKWALLPNSSHMGMWEERERVMRIMFHFLATKT